MRIHDRLHVAWGQTLRGGMRSLLCAGTVAVGVFAMSVIGAVGQCAQDEMTAAIRSLGLRGMTCYLVEQKAGDALTPAFAEQIVQAVPGVSAAMPVQYRSGSYQTGHHSGSALLFGVDEQMGAVLDVELLAGRLFTAGESAQPVRRVVVSERLAREVFGRTEVTGQRIRLTVDGAENYYEILGVIADQTSLLTGFAGGGVPEVIYLPYGLLAQRTTDADQILLACTGETQWMERQLARLAAGQIGLRGTIGVQNLSGYLEDIDGMASQAVLVFLFVAGISLFVALGAVTSGMLSAAHEMREEIGIYRAIGGRQRDVFWIFLMQSGLICFLGAVAGLVSAAGAIWIADILTPFGLSIPLGLAAGCLVLSVMCGGLAGIVPALRAARLDPVRTMRG